MTSPTTTTTIKIKNKMAASDKLTAGLIPKWSIEIEADLIEEVRKKVHLWDIKHPFYLKKSLKKCSYNEIALVLSNRWPSYSSLFSEGKLFACIYRYIQNICNLFFISYFTLNLSVNLLLEIFS
jgi:hypothetical protein